MLLCVDAGNTTTIFRLVDLEGSAPAHTIVIATSYATAADIRRQVQPQLDGLRVTPKDIEGVAAVCVSAAGRPPLEEFLNDTFAAPILWASHASLHDLKIRYYPREAVGLDRLLAAYALKLRGVTPAVAVSMGTATTFNVIDAAGDFIGGAIAPGVGVAGRGLLAGAPALPEVALVAPPAVIASSTAEALRSGAIYGHAALVEGMLRRIAAELGSRPRVVASGGYSPLIAPHCPSIDSIEPELVTDGLRRMWMANTPSRPVEC